MTVGDERAAEITRDEADEILGAFERVALEIYPSRAILAAAFELAVALDHSVYDCLYLALAVAEECALITADARFHAVVAESLLASHVQWVEEDLA